MRAKLGFVAVLVAAFVFLGVTPALSAAPRTSGPLTAVVNLDGSLARGNGAVSSTQLGVDGQYLVTFNRDVSTCAYVASGGEATPNAPDNFVIFTVAPSDANPAAVFVQESDVVLARDSYSSGFHLIVAC